jgi:hypothetical protein
LSIGIQRVGDRHGTLYVLEDPPPAIRPRWYCHWDGQAAPGFDNVDEAVAWGLERARCVLVRTLGSAFFVAGEAVAEYEPEARPWPPSSAERHAIDAAYEDALAAAELEHQRRRAYEYHRLDWLIDHTALATDEPLYTGLIEMPDGRGNVEFEEFATDGSICGARRRGSDRYGFGGTMEVLAKVTELRVDDAWVAAVGEVLGREQVLGARHRRSSLIVRPGRGEMFHASDVVNRWSIEKNGLDWRHMGAAPGIAGSRRPEREAIFLCESLYDVKFFTDMCRRPTDVWGANVDGIWIENGPSGWWMVPSPIPVNRVRLALSDVWSDRHYPEG